MRRPSIWSAFLVLLVYVPWVAAGSQPGSSLDRKFQSAVAQYESGHFVQAAARTNLAANLARVGKLDLAEAEFKKAIKLEPGNFDANHNLGELYARSGKVRDATPFLEQAHRVDASSYDNGYDLALAYVLTRRFSDARQLVQDLLKKKDTA